MNNKLKGLGRSTLRTLAISVIVIIFFVGVILFYYNMVYTREREIIIKNGETSAMQTVSEFNDYLSTSLDAIKMTAYTLDGMLIDDKSSDEILDYLVEQSNVIKNSIFENSTGMYAYIDGVYLDSSGWEPPDDYIPTERPWFKDAIDAIGEVAVVDPYIDAQTGDVMITLAKVLGDGKSVVAFDMTLEKIQSITEEAVKSDQADIEFIIDKNGSVIAHSDKSELNKNYGSETGTLGAAIFEALGSAKDNYFEISHAPSHYIVYTARIQNDWICVSVKDTTSVFASITVILLITIVITIVMVATVAGISVNSARRSIIAERLSKQLSSTADIYISLHEIDFINDSFVEVMNNKSEASRMIGETRNNCQQMIRAIMTKFSDESTRDSILDFVDFTKLDERLKDRNTITTEFLSADGKWRKARYIVSGRLADGRISNAMYLIEDIDAEKRDRDMMQDTAKLLTAQLGCLANIYTSVHDVDIPHDSFTIIKMNDSVVQTAIGNDVQHAQQVIRDAMTKLTDPSCLNEVMEFIEFANIEKNVAETGTATIEFINSRGKWCRGRFIVAERTEDGELSHVMWAVENIDSEKRTRDALAETAKELNYRISSIADIYLTAHEIDLTTDKFIELKSNSSLVKDIMSETHDHAREMLHKIMESVTDESYRDRALVFTNLDTVSKRLHNRNTISFEFLNKDKQWRRGRFVASRRDERGRLTHVLWLSEDIDTEKQKRDKLIDMSERAVAASEAKSAFLSSISNGIRTPLNSVLATNEIIRRDSADEHILECSEKIRRDGGELLGMINDILDYSALESGKFELTDTEYDPSEMIGDLAVMIRQKADEKHLHFVTDIKGGLPETLRGDCLRIKQILTNLLTNAVKYTQKGSVTLSVRCENIPDEPGYVMLKAAVMDTGIGMKHEALERLISDEGSGAGNGIGIGITKKLLKMMDSGLEIESVYELGSKFSFELKQAVADAAAGSAEKETNA